MFTYTLVLILSNAVTYFGFCYYYYIQDRQLIYNYNDYNEHKLQQYNSNIWNIWTQGLLSSIYNTFITTILILYVVPTPTDTFYVYDVCKLLLFVVLSDMWFYITHRMFHTIPYLYRIHKVHHKTHFIVASSGLDTHWLEHILITFGTIFVPQSVLNLSKMSLLLVCVYGNYSVTSSHTANYNSILHTNHHKLLNVNYGTAFYLFDRMLGTYKSH